MLLFVLQMCKTRVILYRSFFAFIDCYALGSLKFFSNIFFESQKPCLVFPNELGPDEVGVSLQFELFYSMFYDCNEFAYRPMLRIRIRHSAGISSSSSSVLSLLNADATVFILVTTDIGLLGARFILTGFACFKSKFVL